MSSLDMAFCLSEDRNDCETGLRLAILSLSRYCPETPVYVYRPTFNSRFAAWLKQFPQVTLIDDRPDGAHTWNCKPQALKPLLAKGYRQVIWLDSDIIVTRDCRPQFANLNEQVLAITQEPCSRPDQGTADRTRAWNLPVQRSLPYTLNSSVVRVTRHHLQLLDRWAEYLAKPEYIATQTIPIEERPIHMASDQEVLNALLGAPDFADIPLYVFKSAFEIIHCGGALGYSTSERLRGMFRPKPTFLHATAGKPWLWLGGEPYWSRPGFFFWHRRLLQELSPYLYEARSYQNQLDEDTAWMFRSTRIGMLLRMAGFGHFAIRGLHLSMAASLMDRAHKISALFRHRRPQSGPATR
jgi:hypothetical protein